MTMTNEESRTGSERIFEVFWQKRSIPGVIEELSPEISATVIKDVLANHEHLSISRFPKREGISKQDIIAALQAASRESATTVDKYQAFRSRASSQGVNCPSAQTIILLYGSWSAALDAAGIAARRRTSRTSLKTYQPGDIGQVLLRFVRETQSTRVKPTQRAYDKWARAQREAGNNVPLLATVRARITPLGVTWNELMRDPTLAESV